MMNVTMYERVMTKNGHHIFGQEESAPSQKILAARAYRHDIALLCDVEREAVLALTSLYRAATKRLSHTSVASFERR